MRKVSAYLVVAAALMAALVTGCEQPTAPRWDSTCTTGGGTGTWDHCTPTGTTTAGDTTLNASAGADTLHIGTP